MTAPDLTMRERIAEVTCNIESSGSVYGVSHWCAAHNASAVDGKPYCNRGLNKADAVLDLWADLPDTAVEAGAKALYEKEREASPVGKHWKDWDPGTTWSEEWRDRYRASHTATIAAIKEGKA